MQTYRPRSAYIWGWLTVAVGLAVTVVQLATTGMADARVGLGLGLALAGSGVAAFLLPSIRVGTSAVEIRNVVQVISVPYGRLEALEAQWSLEVVTDDGKRVGVMAAPARSRRERHRPDQAPPSAAALVVQAGWDAWQRRQDAPGARDAAAPLQATVSRSAHWAGIAAVTAAVIGAAAVFSG